MPTLTTYPDDGPTPRVLIQFSAAELDPTVATINVLQISSAGEFTLNGGVRINAVGGAVLTDYTVPFGVDVTYKAAQFDSAGVFLGYSGGGVARIDIDPGMVVIQDPFAPAVSIRVDAADGYAGVVRGGRPSATYRAGFQTVALMGEPRLPENVPLIVNTRTVAAADELETVLDRGMVLVRSMPDSVRIPAVFYAVVPEYSQIPETVQWGGGWVRWEIRADQVSVPSVAILEPVYTWGLYKAAYATWADAKAAYSTWLDSKLNPPPEA